MLVACKICLNLYTKLQFLFQIETITAVLWFTFMSVYYKVVYGLAMAIYVRILPVISDIHTRGVSVRDDGFSGLGTQTRGVRLHELLL